MILVPIQAVPIQTLAANLAGQAVQIALRQNGDSLYFDLSLGDVLIVSTKICRDRQRLLLGEQYRGFVGDFAFVDTQGKEDPFFTQLGTRYQLYYIRVGE